MSQMALTELIQIVYNLNWRNRRPKDTIASVEFKHGGKEIKIYPDSAEFKITETGAVTQIKWGFMPVDGSVINLYVVDNSLKTEVIDLLKTYLGK